MLVSISVPLLILLVHTVCMVKCTICLFLNLILLPQFHLSLYILIYGVLLHLIPLMALNTMFCSLITLPDLPGFIYLNQSLKSLLSLFNSKPWLKINFLLKLRALDQMVGVSTPPLNSKLTSCNKVLFTNFPVQQGIVHQQGTGNGIVCSAD